ncbi:MAG: hypothetical protein PHS45_02165 [Bacilli bacterium]|nr:hypothetical protein [Bacilli bacterium]
MILRKPYAFLIKRFRLIHLLLTILIGYLIHRTSILLTFLNEYIARGFFRHEGPLASTYLNWPVYLVVLLILGITITIYILMRIKDKPRLYYLLTIIFYTALFILFLAAASNLRIMEYDIIDPRKIRLTRDFILILSIVQYVVIAVALFTAIGFNIKKFDFQKDLIELDIEEKDYEEFEFVLGVDPHRIRTNLRRKWRNIKYTFLENAVVIISLIVVVIVIGVGTYILNITVLNPVYREKDTIKLPTYEITITDSYITNKDYRGVGIGQLASFVVVKFDITNITNNARTLDIDNIRLLVNNYKYTPVITEFDSFFDFGKGYNGQQLRPGEKRSFILVYDIYEKYSKKKMKLEILAGIYGNEVENEIIKLSPKNVSDILLVNTVNLNEEMWFGVSILNKSKLIITDYDINDEFRANYKICILDECNDMVQHVRSDNMSRYDKTILRLGYDFKLDDDLDIEGIKNFADIVTNFGILKYEKNGELITHKVSLLNRTPKYYKGNNIYLEVLDEVKEAKEIQMEFIIRDKRYVYKIK